MRVRSDLNGEAIVKNKRNQQEEGLCFCWRLAKTRSKENKCRGAAAKTVGILSTQNMHTPADL